MPIPVSQEFVEIVSGPHTNKARMDVEVNGVIVEQLWVTEGGVNVDNSQPIRRSVRCRFVAPPGSNYTPQGAADRFNPVAGTVLRPHVGVEIPGTQHIGINFESEDQWNNGTLTDIAVSPSGSISIA